MTSIDFISNVNIPTASDCSVTDEQATSDRLKSVEHVERLAMCDQLGFNPGWTAQTQNTVLARSAKACIGISLRTYSDV